MTNPFPEELLQMLVMSACDGVISSNEKDLILQHAAEIQVPEELVLMPFSHYAFEDDLEHEISDQERISRRNVWIERLCKDSYKGSYEPFPRRIGEYSNLMDKGALNKSLLSGFFERVNINCNIRTTN